MNGVLFPGADLRYLFLEWSGESRLNSHLGKSFWERPYAQKSKASRDEYQVPKR